jgi:hypothetical protein
MQSIGRKGVKSAQYLYIKYFNVNMSAFPIDARVALTPSHFTAVPTV